LKLFPVVWNNHCAQNYNLQSLHQISGQHHVSWQDGRGFSKYLISMTKTGFCYTLLDRGGGGRLMCFGGGGLGLEVFVRVCLFGFF